MDDAPLGPNPTNFVMDKFIYAKRDVTTSYIDCNVPSLICSKCINFVAHETLPSVVKYVI